MLLIIFSDTNNHKLCLALVKSKHLEDEHWRDAIASNSYIATTNGLQRLKFVVHISHLDPKWKAKRVYVEKSLA